MPPKKTSTSTSKSTVSVDIITPSKKPATTSKSPTKSNARKSKTIIDDSDIEELDPPPSQSSSPTKRHVKLAIKKEVIEETDDEQLNISPSHKHKAISPEYLQPSASKRPKSPEKKKVPSKKSADYEEDSEEEDLKSAPTPKKVRKTKRSAEESPPTHKHARKRNRNTNLFIDEEAEEDDEDSDSVNNDDEESENENSKDDAISLSSDDKPQPKKSKEKKKAIKSNNLFMDDILPKGHPSSSLREGTTASAIYDNNADDTTVPVDYQYDPTKLKACELYETHRASKVIHANYQNECLPLPNYYKAVTFQDHRIFAGSLLPDYVSEKYQDNGNIAKNFISMARFSHNHLYINISRYSPLLLRWSDYGMSQSFQSLYRNGESSPAVFLSPGVIHSSYLTQLHYKSINYRPNAYETKKLYHKGVYATLIAIDGDRLVSNICITLPNTFKIQLQAITFPTPDGEDASALQFSSRVGESPEHVSEASASSSSSAFPSPSKKYAPASPTKTVGPSNGSLPRMARVVNEPLPIFDLSSNFDFEKDIKHISQFSRWPSGELEDDTPILIAYNICKNRPKKEGIPPSVSFYICWIGVLGPA